MESLIGIGLSIGKFFLNPKVLVALAALAAVLWTVHIYNENHNLKTTISTQKTTITQLHNDVDQATKNTVIVQHDVQRQNVIVEHKGKIQKEELFFNSQVTNIPDTALNEKPFINVDNFEYAVRLREFQHRALDNLNASDNPN
jgi:uncharacterized membrane protein YhiD involved in acid resistance